MSSTWNKTVHNRPRPPKEPHPLRWSELISLGLHVSSRPTATELQQSLLSPSTGWMLWTRGPSVRPCDCLEKLLGLRPSWASGGRGGFWVSGQEAHDVLQGFNDLSSKPVGVLEWQESGIKWKMFQKYSWSSKSKRRDDKTSSVHWWTLLMRIWTGSSVFTSPRCRQVFTCSSPLSVTHLWGTTVGLLGHAATNLINRFLHKLTHIKPTTATETKTKAAESGSGSVPASCDYRFSSREFLLYLTK